MTVRRQYVKDQGHSGAGEEEGLCQGSRKKVTQSQKTHAF